MASSSLNLPLQQIRWVGPRDEPTVDLTKSERNCGRENKQRWGSPHGLPENHTLEDWRRTNKRSTDWFTSIGQWKCGVRGVKPWRRPAQKPCADDDKQGIHDTDRLCVCAAVQPSQLTANNGNRPITSARNWKVPTKPSAIQEIHRRGRSHKKHIVTAVESVFLSPLVDHMALFGQVSDLTIIQHLFTSYGVIEEIDLE